MPANDAGDGPWSAEASATPGSNDADLSALTVDGTGVDGFAAGTTSYTVIVDRDTTRVTVAATLSDSNAGVEYSPADADTSAGATGHQVDLAGGKTAVTVTVTAEDRTTTKVYTVNFHRPVVPHDWSLRPDGVPTGETFRVLIVTSTTRNATSGDIADYDAHVRSALADRGHADIRDYARCSRRWSRPRAARRPGATPTPTRRTTGRARRSGGSNGPNAADNYVDFYDGSWDHTNPARTESGRAKTFDRPSAGSSNERTQVWTGTRADGTRSGTKHLGTTALFQGARAASISLPADPDPSVWRAPRFLETTNIVGLYGLSAVLYIEPPDSPYATVAEITTVRQTAPTT